jgi:hypothetical protein
VAVARRLAKQLDEMSTVPPWLKGRLGYGP